MQMTQCRMVWDSGESGDTSMVRRNLYSTIMYLGLKNIAGFRFLKDFYLIKDIILVSVLTVSFSGFLQLCGLLKYVGECCSYTRQEVVSGPHVFP